MPRLSEYDNIEGVSALLLKTSGVAATRVDGEPLLRGGVAVKPFVESTAGACAGLSFDTVLRALPTAPSTTLDATFAFNTPSLRDVGDDDCAFTSRSTCRTRSRSFCSVSEAACIASRAAVTAGERGGLAAILTPRAGVDGTELPVSRCSEVEIKCSAAAAPVASILLPRGVLVDGGAEASSMYLLRIMSALLLLLPPDSAGDGAAAVAEDPTIPVPVGAVVVKGRMSRRVTAPNIDANGTSTGNTRCCCCCCCSYISDREEERGPAPPPSRAGDSAAAAAT